MLPLIDKDLEEILPKLYEQENLQRKTFYARFYLNDWEWLVMEYSPLQKLCFGLVDGYEEEYGYFTLDELDSLGAKRDYLFKPINIKDENYGRVA
jgi:hypothetical protein